MNRDEELQRLIEDRDDKEAELAYVEDQIREGLADEEEEFAYMNELENEIMYITALIEDHAFTD